MFRTIGFSCNHGTKPSLAKKWNSNHAIFAEMENGTRPIGKEMTKRLGTALNIGYKVFL
jgi:hypothetical protein